MSQSSEVFFEVTDITYQYAEKEAFALYKQSFTLERGKLLVIIGPSGSGKSTLLHLIAGLLRPSGGNIVMGGKPIHHLPPEKRDLSMIFQKPYLLPFLTVGENVEIGLKMRGFSAKERRNKAEQMLDDVGLTGFYHRPLSSLSGGQEQRVALARSLVIEPQLLLLDEPFSQLDPLLRRQMGRWLLEMKHKLRIPMIMVTHDREEALTLGDQLMILRDGAVQQSDSLSGIYFKPTTRWVAEFLGIDNFVEGTKRGRLVQSLFGDLEVHSDCECLPDGPVEIVIRSEWLHLDPSSKITATIEDSIFRGDHTNIRLRVGGTSLTVKELGFCTYEQGQKTGIRLGTAKVWCLPKEES